MITIEGTEDKKINNNHNNPMKKKNKLTLSKISLKCTDYLN